MIVPDDPWLVVAEMEDGWCLAWRSTDNILLQASNTWPTKEEAEAFQTITRPYLGATAFCTV